MTRPAAGQVQVPAGQMPLTGPDEDATGRQPEILSWPTSTLSTPAATCQLLLVDADLETAAGSGLVQKALGVARRMGGALATAAGVLTRQW